VSDLGHEPPGQASEDRFGGIFFAFVVIFTLVIMCCPAAGSWAAVA